jgi:hypothetical protein
MAETAVEGAKSDDGGALMATQRTRVGGTFWRRVNAGKCL